MATYALVLHEAAAMTLALASRGEQRKLALVLDGLKAAPFQSGDLQEIDAHGRTNEVRIVDDWLITYWPDHAVREMRIVQIERVDD